MAGRETDEADRETDVAGMRDRCGRQREDRCGRHPRS